MRKIILQPVDEHNYIPSINWFKREEGISHEVICFKNSKVMFPNFDNVICLNESIILNAANNDEINNKQFLLEKFQSENELNFPPVDPNIIGHVYQHTFSNLTREMLEGNVFFKPMKEDYLSVNKNMPEGKIVCVNGRNKIQHKFRNNLLINEILFLLKNGVTVFNTTIPQPNLQINHPNYFEVGNECIDYSINVSYFVNADAVLSVANAGAITNHISTQANLILIGAGGWVDNPQFGYEGESLFSAKQKMQGAAVFVRNNLELIDAVNNFSRKKEIIFYNL